MTNIIAAPSKPLFDLDGGEIKSVKHRFGAGAMSIEYGSTEGPVSRSQAFAEVLVTLSDKEADNYNPLWAEYIELLKESERRGLHEQYNRSTNTTPVHLRG